MNPIVHLSILDFNEVMMMKKIPLFLIFYITLCGLVCLFVFILPQSNYTSLENRELLTKESFIQNTSDFTSFKNSIFQTHLRKLVNDQFPLRQAFIKADLLYNHAVSSLMANVLGNDNNPILFKNKEFYQINHSGYYTSIPLKVSDEKKQIFENRLWNFDKIYEKYGNDYSLYLYKPTLANETDWFDETFIYPSEGKLYFTRLKEQLSGKYVVQQQDFINLDDYMNKHYKTDHHWNENGAYQGYTEIINMIKKDYDLPNPYRIQYTTCYDVPFYGSLTMKVQNLYGSDSFCAYHLDDEVNMDILVEEEVAMPGLEEKVFEEDPNSIYLYEEYYGTNYSLIEYTNHSAENAPKILIIADSFSNSINNDLALHFSKTYIVDPRAYTTEDDLMNTTFSLEKFLSEHEVDIILWLQYYESLYFDNRMYLHIDLE